MKIQKQWGVGSGGGQGGCDRRIEVFEKIKKKKSVGGGRRIRLGVRLVGGGGFRVDVGVGVMWGMGDVNQE